MGDDLGAKEPTWLSGKAPEWRFVSNGIGHGHLFYKGVELEVLEFNLRLALNELGTLSAVFIIGVDNIELQIEDEWFQKLLRDAAGNSRLSLEPREKRERKQSGSEGAGGADQIRSEESR